MNNQEIINAVCGMDIKTLDLLLSDQILYQQTTKEIFLKKLDLIFQELKEKDTKLKVVSGSCCSRFECHKNNFGKKGYAFIGENSKKYLSLIFENDENETLSELYPCGSFSIEDNFKDQNLKSIYLVIYEDEKTNAGNYKGKKAAELNEANQEWLKYQNKTLPKNFITKWVKQHTELFLSLWILDNNYKTHDLFYNMFDVLDQYSQLLIYDQEAEEAIISFKKIKLNDELEILEWLRKNYETFCYIGSYETGILKETDLFGMKRINLEYNIWIDTQYMKNCIKFEEIYSKYSYLKGKYNVDDGDVFVEVLGNVLERNYLIKKNQN